MNPESKKVLLAVDDPEMVRRRDRRMFKDRLVRRMMGVGGVGVVVAIMLIFFYLIYEVYPLLDSVEMERSSQYSLSTAPSDKALDYLLDEQVELAFRYGNSGELTAFNVQTGVVEERFKLPIPEGVTISSYANSGVEGLLAAVGLSDGSVIIFQPEFKVSFPNDVRKIRAALSYPLGEAPIFISDDHSALKKLAFQNNEDGTTLVGWQGGKVLSLLRLEIEESMMDDEVALERYEATIDQTLGQIDYLLLDEQQRILYIANEKGMLHEYAISDIDEIEAPDKTKLTSKGDQLTSLKFLTGYISLLVGTDHGGVSQWFHARDEHGVSKLRKVRSFANQKSEVAEIAVEHFRKGFVALGKDGTVGLYHTTSQQELLAQEIGGKSLVRLTFSPRANALLLEGVRGKLQLWQVENEHPEVSWHSLWEEVWYESYDKPEHLWQSSSSSDDFEPKFSLTPLAFGTLKAAFYAMLVAVPIAIFGAIYTAYFMAPRLRQVVKPTIEIMEALPTVILGFLAGLWLAPALEDNLAGVFSLLIILPVGILFFSWFWQQLPRKVQDLVAEGWQPLLIFPAVMFLGWFSFALSQPMEAVFFGGDIRSWLTNDMGIPFDQRNSIVVGVAMGFAVIPTIFSMTEDAVFSVPKHLTFGSLALGATPWQTMTKVVILTASPGIFSAVMIGFGRAVGETMIVLMATGNTPIMDFSIFQGMRTLAANIAVEMPEAEVASTHFRVLFLAALVLFAFTFIFNTAAEVIRQRLREKYSSL
jgi:phosphate transport system permease protein